MKHRTALRLLLFAMAFAVGRCGGSQTPTTNATAPSSSVATIDSVAIVPAESALKLGESRALALSVELGPGVPSSGPLPIWSSSDSTIVAVDTSGVVTGKALGQAFIQVQFRGKSAAGHVAVER